MPDAVIPTVLRIDVEPDEHQPPGGARPWEGLVAMFEMVETLRTRMAELPGGQRIRPTWMIRLDPDIKRAFGSTDFPVQRHAGLFERILEHGDALGIHMHPLRWDDTRQEAYADHADDAWTAECLGTAVETFRRTFGYSPQTVSLGGYFMRNAVLDTVVELGFRADLTVEPGLAAKEHDPSFGARATAPSGNFLNCPRHPYFASRESFDTPAASPSDARPLLMLPLTACDYRNAVTRWVSRVVRREPPAHESLNPWKPWPSARRFWDLAERAASELPAPLLAFALRTEAPGTEMHRRVSGLFSHLPDHVVARRIRIVDALAPAICEVAGEPPPGWHQDPARAPWPLTSSDAARRPRSGLTRAVVDLEQTPGPRVQQGTATLSG